MSTQVNWKLTLEYNLLIRNRKNILLFLIFVYFPYSNTYSCLEQKRSGPRGIISSEMYPLPYPNVATCYYWYIRGQSNDTITVSFSELNLPGNSSHCQGLDCCKDAYIEIGPVHKGSKPYLFCGQNYQLPAFISFRDQIWIKFTTFKNNGFRGFNLTYITGLKNAAYCKKDEVHCSPNGKCILQSWQCNGIVECENGEDETCNVTDSLTKDVEHFFCVSKTSALIVKFPNSKRCDGILDCIDGMDEDNCGLCQLHRMISCGPKESDCYVERDQRCNGVLDCFNGRDEKGCNGCPSNKIQCVSPYTCYSDEERCNGYPQCKDLSDELECDQNRCSILKGLFLCHNRRCILDSWRCNHVDDCGDGSDESYCVCSGNMTSCGVMFRDCYDRYKQRCDGTVDCLNGQDEKGCGKCPPDKIQCSSVCYYEKDRCNGMIQCGDSSDEENCDASLCNPERGGFLCSNKQCIREKWHCDQANDCRDNSDEYNCGLRNSVITAAVMGSLVCGLLLVIAIGCTCKLYALRLSEQLDSTNDGPFFHLDQEFLQREPPPPYAIAMNEQFSCAQAAFMEQIQYAVSTRFGRRHRSRRLRHSRSHSVSNPPQHVSDSSPTDGEDSVQICNNNNSSHGFPEVFSVESTLTSSSSSDLLNSEPNSPLRSIHFQPSLLDNSPFTVHWQCRARNKTLDKVTLDNILPCAIVTENAVQASGSEHSCMHEEHAEAYTEHLDGSTNDRIVQESSLDISSNQDDTCHYDPSVHCNHLYLNDSLSSSDLEMDCVMAKELPSHKV